MVIIRVNELKIFSIREKKFGKFLDRDSIVINVKLCPKIWGKKNVDPRLSATIQLLFPIPGYTYFVRSEIIDGEQFPTGKAYVLLGQSFN